MSKKMGLILEGLKNINESSNMLDVSASKGERYSSGYVSIEFKSGNNTKYPLFNVSYVLNGTGDGWFRRIEGIGKGMGLAITDLKLTSPKPLVVGDFNAYNVKITYISHNDEDVKESGLAWLLVHNRFDIEQVLRFIQKKEGTWVP